MFRRRACCFVCKGKLSTIRTIIRFNSLNLKLKDGYIFDEKFVSKLKTRIRENLSPRHVPAIILSINEIPVSFLIYCFYSINLLFDSFQYTLNGKKVEVPVRRIIEGHNIAPSSSLVNPNVLDLFKNIETLNQW